MKTRLKTALASAVLLGLAAAAHPQVPDKSSILRRVMTYRERLDVPIDTVRTNAYARYYFNSEKRNVTLKMIPTMYAIARGGSEFAGESYFDIQAYDGRMLDAKRRLNVSTVPHHRNTMPTMMRYIMPNMYGKSLLDDQLLSPFNLHNAKLYKYNVTDRGDGTVEIVFRPRRKNTQLVGGSAIADTTTGRIHRAKINGEYDMLHFHIDAAMGDGGQESLYPVTCDITSYFKELGNKIMGTWHLVYGNPVTLPDSLDDSHDRALMEELRPELLPDDIARIYALRDSAELSADSAVTARKKFDWDRFLWNTVGEHLLNRTRATFGNKGQGYFRLSPIINPFYFGYSNSKGITYKMKFRASYAFTPNRDISLYIRAGYAFKQHQFSLVTPLQFNFNKRKQGYLLLELTNGRRISYTTVVDRLKEEHPEDESLGDKYIKYFRDFKVRFVANYEINKHWGLQGGLIYHRRSAVDRTPYLNYGYPIRYYSLAPAVELKYRPFGWSGPVFTADYERGVKAGKADATYEKVELDASWIRKFNRLRTVSMRLGGGFYTALSRDAYFVDYTNFRDENIPLSWNDEWTGEFQLLRGEWYNTSKYYVRANVTFESPMLILSRIPYVGRFMEQERVYINTILVEKLHPYIEVGYGFETRFFSVGAFVASRNLRYERVGGRFQFELFRDW